MDKYQSKKYGNISSQEIFEHYSEFSALDLAKFIRDKKVTSRELIVFVMKKVKELNPSLNAVITLRKASALKEAENLKDEGQPFYGVPLLIKGIGQTMAGESNTMGLVPLKARVSEDTGKYVNRLQELGFIIIGQTNFPELGLINQTKSKLYGNTSNPWEMSRNPGGSSGGATASVAAGIVPIATGNDAGGSLRIPASWTGVIGFKPTRILVTGDDEEPSVVNFAEGKSMADLSMLFENVLDKHLAQVLVKPVQSLNTLKVAFSYKSPVNTKVSRTAIQGVKKAVKFLREHGFTCEQVDAPADGVKLMQSYYSASTSVGTKANKMIKDATGKSMNFDNVSAMTWGFWRADQKQPKSAEDLVNSEIKRVTKAMADFHKKYPIYLTPTTAFAAPLNKESVYLPEDVKQLAHIDDLNHEEQMQLIYKACLHQLKLSPFTQLANISGEPAISLPTNVGTDGLPVGIMFEFAQFHDQLAFQIGNLFEKFNQFKFLKIK